MKKMVSAAGFPSEGGGWYETDFKSGDKKAQCSGVAARKLHQSDGTGSADRPAAAWAPEPSGLQISPPTLITNWLIHYSGLFCNF